ncbi:ABC transporter ATP-binding protein [Bosea sp. NBC_00550]|uniref:ABC transporter ATP-binding protein n=1 Tax=Bosea sp. NBC_00550 TaxID=2969621 RepID=UPI0022303AAB|nr:ABC transporter ATP-binding protein [Bosea sp. NBC_00550]UZF95551.1 ABC transporter ATP-binding protein [Bosea sp. NBC_00550]
MRPSTDGQSLVEIDNLNIAFQAGKRSIVAGRGISFAIKPGEVVALVGESGSGKSTAGLAMLGLLDRTNTSVSGKIDIRRKNGAVLDVVSAKERDIRSLRGNDVAMVFQEPMSSLNPVYRIGDQITEAIRLHRRLSKQEAWVEARRLLDILGVPSPAACLTYYPHQLSGGMRQRVMIAMALSCNPSLLIADEPTTALDVTIQAQIVELLKSLQRQNGMAILFITHDLGLVAEIASRILVMYAGQIVEEGPVAEVFANPRMPYTRALLRSRPQFRGEGQKIKAIGGAVPNLAALPTGCSFHPRCEYALGGLCDSAEPQLLAGGAENRKVRCLRSNDPELVIG